MTEVNAGFLSLFIAASYIGKDNISNDTAEHILKLINGKKIYIENKNKTPATTHLDSLGVVVSLTNDDVLNLSPKALLYVGRASEASEP